ncbi:hypothetical protein A2U01_0082831, partial [Trifolium medium]|nr:hypothetical protein [Trifolium medium]
VKIEALPWDVEGIHGGFGGRNCVGGGNCVQEDEQGGGYVIVFPSQ